MFQLLPSLLCSSVGKHHLSVVFLGVQLVIARDHLALSFPREPFFYSFAWVEVFDVSLTAVFGYEDPAVLVFESVSHLLHLLFFGILHVFNVFES